MKQEYRATALRLLAAAAFSLTMGQARPQPTTEPPQPDIQQPGDTAPPIAPSEPVRPARLPASYGPETASMTAAAAQRYAAIAAAGGWPRITKPITPHSSGKPVAELRRRLAAEGYLSPNEMQGDGRWDDGLVDALRRFQANLGPEETGDVSPATLRELNIPAAARARQLAATANRLAKMRFRFEDRYVSVNIPGASVEAVDHGDVVQRYTAVVGGKRHKSPQVVAKIVAIDINPAWTVPASIIRKELAPRLRRNPNYLLSQHIRILDGRGHEIDPARLRHISNARAAHFTFRQDPGPKNALGSIRIFMPNKDALFMHDTPNKDLFDRDYRFLSHGCVRVEGVYSLASWLLDDTSGDTEDSLRNQVEEGRSERIKLRRPVPVAWVYMTGWATGDGPAHFRKDIYNLDRGTRLPGPSRSVARR